MTAQFRFLIGWVQLVIVFPALSQVTQLFSTNELSATHGRMDFEGQENFTIANFIYTNIGFTFTNDGETSVFLVDSRSVIGSGGSEITTASPYFAMVSSSANHLIVASAQPLTEIGAFFGGGAEISQYYYERLSVYGPNRQLIGSVNVQWDGHPSLDQFIGLRSSVPFYTARFEAFDSAWIPSGAGCCGGVIDDLVFTVVPPPELKMVPLNGEVRISWPTNNPGFVLQETSNLSSKNWLNSPTGSTNPAIVPTTSPTKFYRLSKP